MGLHADRVIDDAAAFEEEADVGINVEVIVIREQQERIEIAL